MQRGARELGKILYDTDEGRVGRVVMHYPLAFLSIGAHLYPFTPPFMSRGLLLMAVAFISRQATPPFPIETGI